MPKVKRKPNTISCKQLKAFLNKFPEDSIVYGYEGEIAGIVVVDKESFHDTKNLDSWMELGYITNDGEETVHERDRG